MKKESKISRVYKEFDTKYAGKTEEEIIEEIARMSSADITQSAINHAIEMRKAV